MWPSPAADLSLTVEEAACFLGDVPGLSAAPPDYGDGDRGTMGPHIAAWDSSFELVAAAFLDPAPDRD